MSGARRLLAQPAHLANGPRPEGTPAPLHWAQELLAWTNRPTLSAGVPVLSAPGVFREIHRDVIRSPGNAVMLGLKHGINRLVGYDPQWPIAFEVERQRIRAALGDTARGIEHYGSTSVEGLRAKPIIDILVGVARLDDWIECQRPLETLGYDYAENAGVAGHFIFGRGRDRTERTHLVHIVEFEGESWRSGLRFRDALRMNPALRAQYLRTKEEAVAWVPEGRARYQDLKHSFIEEASNARLVVAGPGLQHAQSSPSSG